MKEKTPQIQIDKTLFLDLYKWHVGGLCDPEREARIKAGLETKFAKAAAREHYSDLLQERKNRDEQLF
jgi:hypothetical protein